MDPVDLVAAAIVRDFVPTALVVEGLAALALGAGAAFFAAAGLVAVALPLAAGAFPVAAFLTTGFVF